MLLRCADGVATVGGWPRISCYLLILADDYMRHRLRHAEITVSRLVLKLLIC